MQIDYCLILAAGFGTRMGEVGRKLPKVLWPVFEKPLLNLQVAYAKSLGIKNIFINLHFMSDEILASVKGDPIFEDVTFMVEAPIILDIGGAVHALAQRKEINYKGKLLILNADQFFYLTKNELSSVCKKFENSTKLLLTYEVDSNLGYNALEVNEERKVTKIQLNKDIKNPGLVETYTGISLIDLKFIGKSEGPSKFFESVCDFNKHEVFCFNLKDKDYWDFGTINRYWLSLNRILNLYVENPTHKFLRFLIDHKALKSWKIDLKNISYHSNSKQVVNLNPNKIEVDCGPGIYLKGFQQNKSSKPMVYFEGIIDQID